MLYNNLICDFSKNKLEITLFDTDSFCKCVLFGDLEETTTDHSELWIGKLVTSNILNFNYASCQALFEHQKDETAYTTSYKSILSTNHVNIVVNSIDDNNYVDLFNNVLISTSDYLSFHLIHYKLNNFYHFYLF